MRLFRSLVLLVITLSCLSISTQADENNNVVLYGQDSLTLNPYVTTSGGQIGSGGDVLIRHHSTVTGNVFGLGDVSLDPFVTVDGHVIFGGLFDSYRSTDVTGFVSSNVAHAPSVPFPNFEVVAGVDGVTVDPLDYSVLEAGAYGDVFVSAGGTLELSGGLYVLKSLRLQSGAALFVNDPVLILVEDAFGMGTDTEVILAAGLTALDVELYTETMGKVIFGNGSKYRGVLYAQNAIVEIRSNTGGEFTGAVFSKEILVTNQSTVLGVAPCLREDELYDDGIDQDCDGYDLSRLDVDDDGDGETENEGDCDDTDPLIFSAAAEVCDGIDNNCNGDVDDEDAGLDLGSAITWHLDFDGDGYGYALAPQVACLQPGNYVEDATDCDDGNANINPAASEVCDGVDQNCDGDVDDGFDPALCVGGEIFPADPADVADDLDTTVATTIGRATEFLYTGLLPIQTGVSEGVIKERRAAVIRGRVYDEAGSPIEHVNVRVLKHQEYGQTKTRADGVFDMAVNGGGLLTIVYQKDGYLPVHRKVKTKPQRYSWAPDVIMLELDESETPIDLSGAVGAMQTHRATIQSDDDGPRQATVFFPAGRSATMTMPDGTETPLTEFTMVATEYTVGPNGRERMPGDLPGNSGYTYAVELTAKEALSAGASKVTFSEPVYFYLENFLEFPVGEKVPTGYYDMERGVWVPSQDGVIVKVLGDFDADGAAEVDTNGDDVAELLADLTAMGITTEERENLMALYSAGQTLWRVSIPHFTPWDYNWPYTLPFDAVAPDPMLGQNQPEDCPCTRPGSIIECENKVLGQTIGVVGTPFALHYQSNRVAGKRSNYTKEIQITDGAPSASLLEVILDLEIAGQNHSEIFDTAAGQSYSFEWDGKDAYGRDVQGQQELTVSISYIYAGQYVESGDFEASFAQFGNIDNQLSPAGTSRNEIAWTIEESTMLGGIEATTLGFGGGWTLSHHHHYDPVSQVLYLGNGKVRNATGNTMVIETVAGTGMPGFSGDDGPAIYAEFDSMGGMVIDKEGNLYVADARFNDRVRKIDTLGTITTVAGGGMNDPDGVLATEADLNGVDDLTVDGEGNLYLAVGDGKLCKVDTEGIITTIAGDGTLGDSGDGGPAVDAQIYISRLTADDQGNVYIHDGMADKVRKIDTAGIINTVIGTGTHGTSGDGGPASEAEIGGIYDIVVNDQAETYLLDRDFIRKVDATGIIDTIVGSGSEGPLHPENGDLALEAYLRYPEQLAFNPQGFLYYTHYTNNSLPDETYVVRVNSDGTISNITGNPNEYYIDTPRHMGSSDDGMLASTAYIEGIPVGMEIDDFGTIYIAMNNFRIVKIASAYPNFSSEDIIVASEDGDLLYRFDPYGKHLTTINTYTGATVYSFGYDDHNQLVSITDAYNNITTINRDAGGALESLVSPFGQTTNFALNADGYLHTVTNPNGEVHTLGYKDEDGLLTSFEGPNHHIKTYTYDADQGDLYSASSPLAETNTLVNSEVEGGEAVTFTSSEGVVTIYTTTQESDGSETRRQILRDLGLVTESITYSDESKKTTFPSGMEKEITYTSDPRFAMQAPYIQESITRTPSDLTMTVTQTKATELADESDLLSLVSQTTITEVNDRIYTNFYTYNAVSKTGTLTMTTPESRVYSHTVDSQGRILISQPLGAEETSFTYTAQDQIDHITYGETTPRVVDYSYYTSGPSNGLLEKITNPLSEETSFIYDNVGRVTTRTRADLSTVGFAYDNVGNIQTLTTPRGQLHQFVYNANNQRTHYIAPTVSGGGVTGYTTEYQYNADQKLDLVIRADGQEIDYVYETVLVDSVAVPTGRLDYITVPSGQVDYSYDALTGKIDAATSFEGNTVDYDYDGDLLTQVSWVGEVFGSVQFVHNNNFWVMEQKVNDTDTISFVYDNDGLLTAAGSMTLVRDIDSGFLTDTILSGITTNQTYTAFGELFTFSANNGATNLYATSYTYDDLGRVDTLTESVEGVSTVYDYDYDILGRLEHVTQDGVLRATYVYDANGNRTGYIDVVSATTTTGVYDEQDRLQSYGDYTYSYNDAGDLLTKTDGAGIVTNYTYDVFGNLKAVSTSDGGVNVEYVVDANNRRIGKKVSGTLTQGFLYKDQLNPIAELDAGGNVKSRFVYGAKNDVPSYLIREGVEYRIISDHLGSVRLVVRVSDGMILQRMDYDEYGRVINDTNPGFQPFGYAGGLYDAGTGLVRFGARDYDPEVGRWTLKDPIGFRGGDVNLYVYVGNNVVNKIDPYGLYDYNLKLDPDFQWDDDGSGYDECVSCSQDERKDASKLPEDEWDQYEGARPIPEGAYEAARGDYTYSVPLSDGYYSPSITFGARPKDKPSGLDALTDPKGAFEDLNSLDDYEGFIGIEVWKKQF